MKYAACLPLALALCAVGLSRAADKATADNYEHLKQLEPLIGTWTGEWAITKDRPTTGLKKGEKHTLTVTWTWGVKKSSILNQVTLGEPGSAPVYGQTWLIGWDTANKRILSSGFEATGGHALTHDWEIKGDKVSFKGKGSLGGGNKTAWTMVISDVSKDTCTWEMTEFTVDGKKVPADLKWTLKRVKAK